MLCFAPPTHTTPHYKVHRYSHSTQLIINMLNLKIFDKQNAIISIANYFPYGFPGWASGVEPVPRISEVWSHQGMVEVQAVEYGANTQIEVWPLAEFTRLFSRPCFLSQSRGKVQSWNRSWVNSTLVPLIFFSWETQAGLQNLLYTLE